MVNSRIEVIQGKKLIGINLKMSLINNRTRQLWGQFMPRKSEIVNSITEDRISLQEYPADYFTKFNPNTEFEKWAAVEVNDFQNTPDAMEALLLVGGLYVVFECKGLSNSNEIFEYIFSNWIPNSEYKLDDRPHFEVLGEKYKNNDSNSEEEIWIPIQLKYTPKAPSIG